MPVRPPFAGYVLGIGAGLGFAAACGAPSGNATSGFGGGQSAAGSSSVSTSSTSAPAILVSENDASLGAVTPASDASAIATSSDSGRPERCTDAGCTCFSIASIGHLGIYGDNTTELINWLNTESSTTVALYETKPTLTADFLNQYDVIILQWLSDGTGGPYWQFSQSEVSALSDWVHAGGGLITLSGFEPNTGEVAPLNTLLSFSDLSYNTDDILFTCPASLMCSCWDNTVPVGPWTPGPIGDNITQVGAYHGRSINPGAATIDASGQGSDAGTLVYAAHEAVGAGFIFAWCDEWVTYTSQWLAVPPANGGVDPYTTPGNACYEMSAAQVFQVPQFWYNAITYASQATSCPFTINNSAVIPR